MRTLITWFVSIFAMTQFMHACDQPRGDQGDSGIQNDGSNDGSDGDQSCPGAEQYLDPGFGQGGLVYIDSGLGDDELQDMVATDDGGLLVAGGGSVGMIVRLNSDGSLMTSFGQDGTFLMANPGSIITSIARDSDGILFSATVPQGTENCIIRVGRLDASGVLDQTFGDNGYRDLGTATDIMISGAVLAQGVNWVVVGYDASRWGKDGPQYLRIWRLDQEGRLDLTFGDSGSGMFVGEDIFMGWWHCDAQIMWGNDIVVGGEVPDRPRLVRVNSQGTSTVQTFGDNGVLDLPGWGMSSVPEDLLRYSDGSLIVMGNMISDGMGGTWGLIFRVLESGTVQQVAFLSFDIDGPHSGENIILYGATEMDDGSLIVTGLISNWRGHPGALLVARLTTSWEFDSSFPAGCPGGNGILRIECDGGKAILRTGESSVVVGGMGQGPGGDKDMLVARLTR